MAMMMILRKLRLFTVEYDLENKMAVIHQREKLRIQSSLHICSLFRLVVYSTKLECFNKIIVLLKITIYVFNLFKRD